MNNPVQASSFSAKVQYMSLGLLAMMLVLPFLVNRHLLPNTAFWSESLAIALGLFASFGLLAAQHWKPLRFPTIALVPLAMIVVLLLQVSLGLMSTPNQHLMVAVYFLWAAVLMLLGAALRHCIGLPGIVPVLALALLAGGLINVVLQGFQLAGVTLGGYIIPPVRGYHANLGQVNHLADYLGLSIASLAYLHATRRLRLAWALTFLLVLLAGLAVTAARAGWLYIILIMVLAWLAQRNYPGEPSTRLWKLSWALIPGFVLVQVLLPYLPVELVMPGQAVISKAGADSARVEWVHEAWTIFQTNPLLGVGFGQFSWHQFQLAWPNTPEGYHKWIEHSHNIIAQLLAETGVAGTLILLVGVGAWLWNGRKVTLNPERWWLIALLGVMGIHAMLEYPLWYAYFLGLAALLLGLGDEKPLLSSLRSGRWLLGLLLLIGVALMFVTIKQNVVIEKWVVRGLSNRLKSADAEVFQREILTVAKGSLLMPAALSVLDVTMKANRENLSQKLLINTAAMQHHPTQDAAFRRATLLALNGQEKEAVTQLRRTLIAFPPSDKKRTKYVLGLMRLMNRGETAVLPLLMEMMVSGPPPEAGAKVKPGPDSAVTADPSP